jgi:branched-subunit amino acid ABC-type transport system permease component
MATLLQQVINGLSLGSVYALIAVGYSLVYSILLFSNFAHGGFLVIGGYLCYGALKTLGLSIWVAGFISLLGAGVAAVVTERIAYKPIRERTRVTLYLLSALPLFQPSRSIFSILLQLVLSICFLLSWHWWPWAACKFSLQKPNGDWLYGQQLVICVLPGSWE